MSGGVLEVLLVNAEGLKHARLPGSTSHVIIECGVHTIASKFTTDDNGEARWNEKFSFKLSHLDLKKLTRMKLGIIRQDKFFEDYHIGEATIHLMDILKEGIRRGSIELKPAPYNVVLEDRTFKGEIKVGLKFISDAKNVQSMNTRYRLPEKQSQSLYEIILNLTLRWIFWPRFFFYFMNRSAKSSTESKKAIQNSP